jgi:hypothetical protein
MRSLDIHRAGIHQPATGAAELDWMEAPWSVVPLVEEAATDWPPPTAR